MTPIRDALELLTAQHEQIEDLFEQVRQIGDEAAFTELVSRFHLVLDTNRTAPAVMRIMVSAEAARTAADEAADPTHGWLSRRYWRKEADRTSRELVSHVAATLDALIDEPY
jgi:hypothetical protein